MTLTQIFTFATADEAAQDFAVSTFKSFKDTCKKNGASYIVATHATKVKVLQDTTNGAAWTVYASITFNNEDDANYFAHEDPVNQEVKSKNQGMTAGLCIMEGSFS
ncbi:hypothetical protein F4802DRAFT_242727 [Xylaria palmicola]|nr:hypothetical protein F4802DRAFT_242727 [Xylaria palmicola]